MQHVVLIGPQRFEPTLKATLESIDVRGPVAVVTAGWQEREGEDDELREHLQRDTLNLRLYERYEHVLQRDPELRAALRLRQEQFQQLQALYRLRLDHALAPARELLGRTDGGSFLVEHQRAAIRVLKTVDRQHVARLRTLHQAFQNEWKPGERPAVARHRRELARVLEPAAALAIAGGHVAVLVNRLRLFDLRSLLGERPIIAWSAGAMALAERVVLFHDSPPQGPGNSEVLDTGLAYHRKLVPLPGARYRLRLNDRVRVSLFVRRFSPASCALLDEGARLDWDGRSWTAGRETRRLSWRGDLRRMGGGG